MIYGRKSNAAGISERRRMYAIDFIGSAGKGTQTRPLLTRADCGSWLADVINMERPQFVDKRLLRFLSEHQASGRKSAPC